MQTCDNCWHARDVMVKVRVLDYEEKPFEQVWCVACAHSGTVKECNRESFKLAVLKGK